MRNVTWLEKKLHDRSRNTRYTGKNEENLIIV